MASCRDEEGKDEAAAGGYAEQNSALKALYHERIARTCARRWAEPETLEFAGRCLKLCSLPGLQLGSHAWHSGNLLAQAIAEERCPILRGARCLELGAGIGLAGLSAASFGGAASVVLTDREELQALLQHNIEVNSLGRCCRAEVLLWGAAPPAAWGDFDVVLAADVIYPTKDPTSHEALLTTILAVCSPGSSRTFLLAYHARTEDDFNFLHKRLLPNFDVEVEDVKPNPSGTHHTGNSKVSGDGGCQLYTLKPKSA